MQVSHWHVVKDYFLKALELPPDERNSFLRSSISDPQVLDEVCKLLSWHVDNESFLVSPIDSDRVASLDELNQRLRGFQLIRRIGCGGMGTVYEALQDQPRRRVAIKLLRPGPFESDMSQRMHRESAILGRLQHPGIAQVYAAGSIETSWGCQPWFAMELIDGTPIDEFARRESLTTERRLRLLIAVARAVQHAHERGIIHRDLKPANILVERAVENESIGPQSGSWPIKVLDFGVARVVSPDWNLSRSTLAGDLVGTPGYISPEQLVGDPALVDPRSDVYSLAVVGYQLLTGQIPHPRGNQSIFEYIRRVETEEPVPLGRHFPNLGGDLEVIFAKALERDPNRRYSSIADLADDWRRFLDHEPITARRATAVYRGRKFVRRHRALVGGTLTTLVALSVGLILYASEAKKARRAAQESAYEASKAMAVNNFITNDFLTTLLTTGTRDAEGYKTVIDHVDLATRQIGTMFENQPLSEAAVRNEVGTIYYNLRAYSQAAEQFRSAWSLWESLLGSEHADTLKGLNNLGQALQGLGRLEEAEGYFRQALEGRRRRLGALDPATLATMNNLAVLLAGTDRRAEAEAMMREALSGLRKSAGVSAKETLIATANLGTFLIRNGNIDEGLELHRHVYEACCRTLGAQHVMTRQAAIRLAQSLHRARKYDEAHQVLTKTLDELAQAPGATDPETILARRVLARVFRDLDRHDQAVEQLELALETARSSQVENTEVTKQIERDLSELTRTR